MRLYKLYLKLDKIPEIGGIPVEERTVNANIRYIQSMKVKDKRLFILQVKKEGKTWGGYIFNPQYHKDASLIPEIQRVRTCLLDKYG